MKDKRELLVSKREIIDFSRLHKYWVLTSLSMSSSFCEWHFTIQLIIQEGLFHHRLKSISLATRTIHNWTKSFWKIYGKYMCTFIKMLFFRVRCLFVLVAKCSDSDQAWNCNKYYNSSNLNSLNLFEAFQPILYLTPLNLLSVRQSVRSSIRQNHL